MDRARISGQRLDVADGIKVLPGEREPGVGGELPEMEHMSAWRKSTYSGGASGNCTEIATVTGAVLIRDSKNPDGPRLSFAPRAWEAFAAKVKQG